MKDIHLAVEGFFGWCSIREIQRAKASLDELERDGLFSEWQPGSWWHPSWVPFLQFNLEEHVCIDLAGSLGCGVGAVFVRRNNDTTRVVLAPSFDAWLDAHIELTLAGPANASEDEWVDHFDSAKARNIRSRILPAFPVKVKAKKAPSR